LKSVGDNLENNWGGSREGSGRKRITDEMKRKGYTFQLTGNELNFIDSFQGGNRSERLRNMIDNYKILKKQFDKSNGE
jgi:hypothetical protein